MTLEARRASIPVASAEPVKKIGHGRKKSSTEHYVWYSVCRATRSYVGLGPGKAGASTADTNGRSWCKVESPFA